MTAGNFAKLWLCGSLVITPTPAWPAVPVTALFTVIFKGEREGKLGSLFD
jgi:hypothetical protein